MIKYSIIVPTYNSYESLKRLLLLFEKQIYKYFEIIIIDDCSTDLTYENTISYNKTSKLDIVIYKNNINKGAGFSRNIGIDLASGDYIIFVDSDDVISDNLLKNINIIHKKNTAIDLILFNLIRVVNGKEKCIKTIRGFKDGYVDNESALLYSTTCVAGKCFKSELLKTNKFYFPNIIRYEDWVFNIMNISKCKKIYYLDQYLYFYIDNKNSIVNRFENKSIECSKKAINIMKDSNLIKSDILAFFYFKETGYLSVKSMIKTRRFNKSYYNEIQNELIKSGKWFNYVRLKYMPKHQVLVLLAIKIRLVRVLSIFRNRRD